MHEILYRVAFKTTTTIPKSVIIPRFGFEIYKRSLYGNDEVHVVTTRLIPYLHLTSSISRWLHSEIPTKRS